MNVKKIIGFILYSLIIFSVGLYAGYSKSEANYTNFISATGDSVRKLGEANKRLEQRNSELDGYIDELNKYNSRLRIENDKLNITIGRIQNYSIGANNGVKEAIRINKEIRKIVEGLPD